MIEAPDFVIFHCLGVQQLKRYQRQTSQGAESNLVNIDFIRKFFKNPKKCIQHFMRKEGYKTQILDSYGKHNKIS